MRRVVTGFVLVCWAFGCGPIDVQDAAPTPTPPLPLANGLYEVLDAQLTTDDCFQFQQWTVGTQFGVDIEDDTVTVSGVYAMQRADLSTFAGSMEQVSDDPTYDCRSRSATLLDGEVVGENAFTWQVDYGRTAESGSQCALINVPCQSSIVMTLSL